MRKQIDVSTQIDLSADTLVKARRHAHMLGMSLSEYMESLVDRDVVSKENDPWLEPVPPEVDAMWEQDIAEAEEEEKRTGKPRKTYHTADEYIKDMQDSE